MTRLMKTLHVREVSTTMSRGTTIPRGATVPTYNPRDLKFGLVWILDGRKEIVLKMVRISNGI